jgi:hypothetical protein
MKAVESNRRLIGIALVVMILATLWAVAVHNGWKCDNARTICPVCVVAGGSWAPSENHCYELQQTFLEFGWHAVTDLPPQQITHGRVMPRAPPAPPIFNGWALVS